MRFARLIPSLVAACVAATCSVVVHAQHGPQPTLPLKRVRLYEAGVAYFERAGPLPAGAAVTLPVPAGHLDDALKTLVVLGQSDKTHVSAIEFASCMSRDMARAMVGLPADGSEGITHYQLISSLKGAQVELQAQVGTFQGRLVDIIQPTEAEAQACLRMTNPHNGGGTDGDGGSTKCLPEQQTTVLMLTDRGEVRRFRVGEIKSVRPTDPAMVTRIRSALDAASSRASQAQRTLGVMASSSVPVRLGYIAEAPVWRATYRMVLDASAPRGVLQGWALLHNDTDEEWRKVSVELVNGQPDSFLFPLAAPRYARRELRTPSVELSTVPQLQDTTVDNMWRGDSYGAGGLGLSGIGEGGGGRGEGIGLGTVGTIGHGAGTATGALSSTALTVGDLASIGQVDSVESGALFQYTLQSPVDLRAHGSALVPFVYEALGARRIAWMQSAGEPARAAIHLKNDTKQTLPPGTIAIFADSGFAGESSIDRLKPSEQRIVTFGADLDVELQAARDQMTDETRLLAYGSATVAEHFVRHHSIAYDITNRSGVARTVYLGLDFVNNAQVKGVDELEYDATMHKAVAVFQVQPKSHATRQVEVDEGLKRDHPYNTLTAKMIKGLAAATHLPPSQKTILLEAARLLTESDQIQGKVAETDSQRSQIESDLPRVRANLDAIARARASGANELARKLVDAEKRVDALRMEAQGARAQARDRRIRAGVLLTGLSESAATH